jgi:signal transduction histidine kinase
MSVLLLEDLPIYITLVKRLLALNGIMVEHASTLTQAIEIAQRTPFDAVLLDLGLPDSQGISTFTRFQSYFPNLPIIIFSNLEDETLAARAVQLGAQDYITKGSYLTQGEISGKLLARSIQYAIERQRVQSSLIYERTLLEERVTERTRELNQANQHLRHLAARLVSAQEDERRRISLELHDEAGQALTALKLSLALTRNEVPANLANIAQRMQDAIQLVENTIEHIRTLAQNLHPPSLDSLGLEQCLQSLCENLSHRSKISIQLHTNLNDRLPGHIQISIYRVVQEALNNAIKHANPSCIHIRLESDAERISLLVVDDGKGFSPEHLAEHGSGSGLGLQGMRERIDALGGSFEIYSSPGAGTRLVASVPMDE